VRGETAPARRARPGPLSHAVCGRGWRLSGRRV